MREGRLTWTINVVAFPNNPLLVEVIAVSGVVSAVVDEELEVLEDELPVEELPEDELPDPPLDVPLLPLEEPVLDELVLDEDELVLLVVDT